MRLVLAMDLRTILDDYPIAKDAEGLLDIAHQCDNCKVVYILRNYGKEDHELLMAHHLENDHCTCKKP